MRRLTGLTRHKDGWALTNVGRWLTANQFFCGPAVLFGGPFLVRLELPQLRSQRVDAALAVDVGQALLFGGGRQHL